MMLLAQAEAARAAGALMGMLCVLGVTLVIVTLVGTAVLMGACKLFNTMVHKPKSRNGVPMPSVGKAMGVIFIQMIISVVITLALAFAMGAIQARAAGGEYPRTTFQLISNCVGFVALVGLLTAMLPTSIGRALLVTLLYYAIATIITVMILLVIVTALGSLPGT